MTQAREKKERKTRCGMVVIIGRPNVGKSTLLNELVGEKVAIVSKVPQTTRNQIRGIFTDERGQIVFIDTPGFLLGRDRLDKCMQQASDGMIDQVDCVLYLVDTSRTVGQEEEAIAKRIAASKVPVVLGFNKVDLHHPRVEEYIALWEKTKGMPVTEMKNMTMIALSGKDHINLDDLLEIIFGYLPEGPLLYPEDTVCDVPQRIVIADIVREKLFQLTQQELPHSIGVAVEQMQYVARKKVMVIKIVIFVERDSQKEIVIGKNGQMLKKVGTLARKELEDLLEQRVFLECYVKAHKGWRDDFSLLQELGYSGDVTS